MKVNKAEGEPPFHGRIENKKSGEDLALARSVLNRPLAPDELEFKAEAGSHPPTERVARIIFGANS